MVVDGWESGGGREKHRGCVVTSRMRLEGVNQISCKPAREKRPFSLDNTSGGGARNAGADSYIRPRGNLTMICTICLVGSH